MAPSVVSHQNNEEDVLDAEIMKAIRNSLKELSITSPLRPSRPPPGANASDDDTEAEAEFEEDDDDPISMITKASEIEHDDAVDNFEDNNGVQETAEEENEEIVEEEEDNTLNEDVPEVEAEEDYHEVSVVTEVTYNEECSKASSKPRKKKIKKALYKAQLKQAIDASLADISQHSGASNHSTPTKVISTSRPLTPIPPPIAKKPLSQEERQGSFRPLIIDGSSMGFAYGNHDRFVGEGIRVAFDCFKTLGYEDENIIIILKHIPQHYKSGHDQAIIDYYHKKGILHYCPSRYAGDVLIKSNDDLFMLKTASELEGVILSHDRFREYWELYPEYRDVLMYRLIQPTFIKDQLILPLDPLGLQGPELDQVLRFND